MNAHFDACLITLIDYEINLQIAQALSLLTVTMDLLSL